MATELIDSVDYGLTRFAGKDGVMYQITQYNEQTKRHEYVCLSEKQIDRISKKIKKEKIKKRETHNFQKIMEC